jgi:hypothetical protein
MSDVMFFDAAPRQSDLLRRIAIIAIGLSLALAAHQIGSTLISCFRVAPHRYRRPRYAGSVAGHFAVLYHPDRKCVERHALF